MRDRFEQDVESLSDLELIELMNVITEEIEIRLASTGKE